MAGLIDPSADVHARSYPLGHAGKVLSWAQIIFLHSSRVQNPDPGTRRRALGRTAATHQRSRARKDRAVHDRYACEPAGACWQESGDASQACEGGLTGFSRPPHPEGGTQKLHFNLVSTTRAMVDCNSVALRRLDDLINAFGAMRANRPGGNPPRTLGDEDAKQENKARHD